MDHMEHINHAAMNHSVHMGHGGHGTSVNTTHIHNMNVSLESEGCDIMFKTITFT